MSTTFILLALYVSTTPRPSTWVAEFLSRQMCERAGAALAEKVTPLSYRFTFVCVEK